jgi:MoaA/NifB/PqqE/SkfB family radical SAM enzyme
MAEDFIGRFDGQIAGVFGHLLKAAVANPGLALFFARARSRQERSARRREEWRGRGVHVPPLLIASITGRCNLNCAGCYARVRRESGKPELSIAEWRNVFAQAQELGVSVVMLAGGEPLVRPEILGATREFPDIIFPLFTNGLLLDDAILGELRAQHQLIPVLSIEGRERETDARRGRGVFDHVLRDARRLSRAGVFFGASLTVTRENFELVTDAGFVESGLDAGCRMFIFVEYTPVETGTEDLVLTKAQKQALVERVYALQEKKAGVFIVFPGDEEQFGGCLAAGRGFVHVGPDGSLEPCPFAPYSDVSLKTMPLKDALGSKLLQAIRDNHDRLSETRGGCALWAEREWIKSLLAGGDR